MKKRNVLRCVVELNLYDGAINSNGVIAPGSGKMYAIEVDGELFGNCHVRDASTTQTDQLAFADNEDAANAYRHFIESHLKEDLKLAVKEHAAAAWFCAKREFFRTHFDSPRILRRHRKDYVEARALYSRLRGERERARGLKRVIGGSEPEWTRWRRTRFLKLYEEVYDKVNNKPSELPEHVRSEILNKKHLKIAPRDIALKHTAKLFGVPHTSYLLDVLKEARRERKVRNNGQYP